MATTFTIGPATCQHCGVHEAYTILSVNQTAGEELCRSCLRAFLDGIDDAYAGGYRSTAGTIVLDTTAIFASEGGRNYS